MEHFIRTVCWIIFLSHCLLANPLDKERCIENLMEKDIKCPLDSRFYVHPENIQKPCIMTALICAREELNGTVRVECDGPKGRIDQGLKDLRSYIRHWEDKNKDPVPTAATECKCEAWPQVSFKEFLDKTKTLKQLINSI